MLGRFPLPIEIVPFGAGGDPARGRGRDRRGRLPGAGAAAQGDKTAMLSSRMAGTGCLTPRLQRIPDPRSLAARLSAIPGVVEHGLFIGLVRTAIVAGPDGVRIVERP